MNEQLEKKASSPLPQDGQDMTSQQKQEALNALEKALSDGSLEEGASNGGASDTGALKETPSKMQIEDFPLDAAFARQPRCSLDVLEGPRPESRHPKAAKAFCALLAAVIAGIFIWQGAGFLQGLERPRVSIHAEPTVAITSLPAAPDPANLIDLNTADAKALDTLPGIGPGLAKAILEYRAQYDRFYFPEELMDVRGIGVKRFDALKELIFVAPPVLEQPAP